MPRMHVVSSTLASSNSGLSWRAARGSSVRRRPRWRSSLPALRSSSGRYKSRPARHSASGTPRRAPRRSSPIGASAPSCTAVSRSGCARTARGGARPTTSAFSKRAPLASEGTSSLVTMARPSGTSRRRSASSAQPPGLCGPSSCTRSRPPSSLPLCRRTSDLGACPSSISAPTQPLPQRQCSIGSSARGRCIACWTPSRRTWRTWRPTRWEAPMSSCCSTNWRTRARLHGPWRAGRPLPYHAGSRGASR
mmetsp:Transcript_15538/g.35695  ORF Transcript_15538/g.35695 Transcript_15538/m.35695 type:complete len:250 (+) Transcript_15538:156-905(+)